MKIYWIVIKYILLYIPALFIIPFLFFNTPPKSLDTEFVDVFFFLQVINFTLLTTALAMRYFMKLEGFSSEYYSLSIYLSFFLIFGVNYFICRPHTGDNKGLTEEESYALVERIAQKRYLKLSKLQKKTTFYHPEKKQELLDKKFVASKFDSLLSQPYYGNKDGCDSAYCEQIYSIMNCRFHHNLGDSTSWVNALRIIRYSLTLDLMVYSPDFRYLVAVFTYNSYTKESKFDYQISNSFCCIGERKKNTIHLYPQDYLAEDYLTLNKEAAYFRVLDRLNGYDFFGGDSFWERSEFFDQVVSTKTGRKDCRFKFYKGGRDPDYSSEEIPDFVVYFNSN